MPVTSITLPKELTDRLDAEAERTGASKAEIIRRALCAYFGDAWHKPESWAFRGEDYDWEAVLCYDEGVACERLIARVGRQVQVILARDETVVAILPGLVCRAELSVEPGKRLCRVHIICAGNPVLYDTGEGKRVFLSSEANPEWGLTVTE